MTQPVKLVTRATWHRERRPVRARMVMAAYHLGKVLDALVYVVSLTMLNSEFGTVVIWSGWADRMCGYDEGDNS